MYNHTINKIISKTGIDIFEKCRRRQHILLKRAICHSLRNRGLSLHEIGTLVHLHFSVVNNHLKQSIEFNPYYKTVEAIFLVDERLRLKKSPPFKWGGGDAQEFVNGLRNEWKKKRYDGETKQVLCPSCNDHFVDVVVQNNKAYAVCDKDDSVGRQLIDEEI